MTDLEFVNACRDNRQWIFDALDSSLDWGANAYQRTFLEKVCREVFEDESEVVREYVLMYLRKHNVSELNDGTLIMPAYVWPNDGRIEISNTTMLEDIF